MKKSCFIAILIVCLSSVSYGSTIQDSILKPKVGLGFSLGFGLPEGFVGCLDLDFKFFSVGGSISRFKYDGIFWDSDQIDKKLELRFPFIHKKHYLKVDPAIKFFYLQRNVLEDDHHVDNFYGFALSLASKFDDVSYWNIDFGTFKFNNSSGLNEEDNNGESRQEFYISFRARQLYSLVK